MNCRRVSSQLSAYLDVELTGAQMLEIGAHLEKCPTCRKEYESLRETKHLLGALAMQAPRAEFDALLQRQCAEANRPAGQRLAEWMTAWRGGAIALPRPRPMVLAAGLSLGAVLMATSTISVSTDAPEVAAAPSPGAVVYTPPVQASVFPASVSMPHTSSLILAGGSPVVWPVSESPFAYATVTYADRGWRR